MDKTDQNVIPLPSAEMIEAEAAQWLAALGRAGISDEEIGEFEKWRAQSDRHREIFSGLSALWDDLEVLKDLDDIAEAALSRAPRPNRRRMLAAAAAGLAIVGVGIIYERRPGAAKFQNNFYATAVGDQTTITLEDGSSVLLNTDSELRVEFERDRRLVRLGKGEALFDVAHDAQRPFLVVAADGVVRAVGTAFSVRLRDNDSVEVTVVEGRVALSRASGAQNIGRGEEVAELSAGQNALFNKGVEQIKDIPESEINRKLSWRQGVLAYAGEPLEDVIADISRYTDMDIEIEGEALRKMPVGGYFRVGEVDALFESLELTFGLTVEHLDAQRVKLSLPA
ncbi:MAG: FecR domain-containing protein [Parvularculaceae bacterium]|nr:FecR domain-containing protein [Parvularculaceae bacterium]